MTTTPQQMPDAGTGPAAEHAAPLRVPLSRQRVLEAALGLADEQGLDALSMRRLGAELGVEAMSLYRYFASKDALLDGLTERLWDEVWTSEDGDWKAAVLGTAHSLRRLAHTHPNVYSLLLGRKVLPEPALRVFDALLNALRGAGFSYEDAAQAMGALLGYATGYAMVELSCRLGQSDLIAEGGIPAGAASRFANVTRALTECDCDAQFNFGLESIIEGLEARLQRGSV